MKSSLMCLFGLLAVGVFKGVRGAEGSKPTKEGGGNAEGCSQSTGKKGQRPGTPIPSRETKAYTPKRVQHRRNAID